MKHILLVLLSLSVLPPMCAHANQPRALKIMGSAEEIRARRVVEDFPLVEAEEAMALVQAEEVWGELETRHETYLEHRDPEDPVIGPLSYWTPDWTNLPGFIPTELLAAKLRWALTETHTANYNLQHGHPLPPASYLHVVATILETSAATIRDFVTYVGDVSMLEVGRVILASEVSRAFTPETLQEIENAGHILQDLLTPERTIEVLRHRMIEAFTQKEWMGLRTAITATQAWLSTLPAAPFHPHIMRFLDIELTFFKTQFFMDAGPEYFSRHSQGRPGPSELSATISRALELLESLIDRQDPARPMALGLPLANSAVPPIQERLEATQAQLESLIPSAPLPPSTPAFYERISETDTPDTDQGMTLTPETPDSASPARSPLQRRTPGSSTRKRSLSDALPKEESDVQGTPPRNRRRIRGPLQLEEGAEEGNSVGIQ